MRSFVLLCVCAFVDMFIHVCVFVCLLGCVCVCVCLCVLDCVSDWLVVCIYPLLFDCESVMRMYLFVCASVWLGAFMFMYVCH